MSDETREKLSAAIRANLNDARARLVWGDFLQQNGELEVGELVMGSASDAAAYVGRTFQLPPMQATGGTARSAGCASRVDQQDQPERGLR